MRDDRVVPGEVRSTPFRPGLRSMKAKDLGQPAMKRMKSFYSLPVELQKAYSEYWHGDDLEHTWYDHKDNSPLIALSVADVRRLKKPAIHSLSPDEYRHWKSLKKGKAAFLWPRIKAMRIAELEEKGLYPLSPESLLSSPPLPGKD